MKISALLLVLLVACSSAKPELAPPTGVGNGAGGSGGSGGSGGGSTTTSTTHATTTSTAGTGGSGGGCNPTDLGCCVRNDAHCPQEGAPACAQYEWCGEVQCQLKPLPAASACTSPKGPGTCDGESTDCNVIACQGDPSCCVPNDPHCSQSGAPACGSYQWCGDATCKVVPNAAGSACHDAQNKPGTCDGTGLACNVVACQGDDTCCVTDPSHCSQSGAPVCGEYLWCGAHICNLKPKGLNTPCSSSQGSGVCDGASYACVVL